MFSSLKALFARPNAIDRARASAMRGSPHQPTQHWTIDHFPSRSGPGAEGSWTCHLGTVIAPGRWHSTSADTHHAGPGIPFDEEFFEWADLLEAVLEADDTFTFAEIGAGYGRWSARAAAAARQKGKLARLILAEAEPYHLSWIDEHLQSNGVSPDQYEVVEGAVGSERRTSVMSVGMPDNEWSAKEWYGQQIGWWRFEERNIVGDYMGRPLFEMQGWQFIEVPEIPLTDVLARADYFDLIDFDIQGAEGPAVAGSIGELTAKARRLHIETHHGEEVEIQLREVLSSAGWVCLRDYPCEHEHVTPFGTSYFQGGAQSWINPKLV